jgi:predicted AlkP superfamily phosphohydrolase/phosphomutase
MPARVLVVAFDACDIDLALPWAERGLLPNLAKCLGEAWTVETRCAPGLFAGAVWPSLVTGVSVARHRRYFRRRLRITDYADVDFTPNDIAFEPFWETLSRAGRRVVVIDVPHSRLSPRINGIHVVDWTAHDPEFFPACSEPAHVLPDLTRRFGELAPDACNDMERTPEGIAQFLRTLTARVDHKVRASCQLLAEDEWDLFFTVFGEAHCVGHQLFHQHASDHPLHDSALTARLGDPLLTLYQSLDRALGELLADAGAQATMCVLLSQGMGPVYTDENAVLDDVLRSIEGSGASPKHSRYAQLRRQWYRLPLGFRQSAPVSRLYTRVMPSLHRSLLFPERGRRRFFATLNNAAAGAIRINLAGREPNGQVQTEEYDAVCEELRREFLAFVDPETGERWVRDVVRSRGLYEGPFADELPDLVVEWNRSRPLPLVRSPRLGVVRPPPVTNRTGDHINHGAFLIRGPGIRPGRAAQPVDVVQIAPTLARLLGVALDNTDGAPIGECVP